VSFLEALEESQLGSLAEFFIGYTVKPELSAALHYLLFGQHYACRPL
jgi:hypothetical protein